MAKETAMRCSPRDLSRGDILPPRLAWSLLVLSLAACGRIPTVRFANDTCFIDNAPAGIVQVEREEARLSQHMIERQPLFILVTLMVVVLAGAGYVLRIVDVIAVRGEDGLGFLDRLRQALERHRAHPARYFAMLAGTFALLLIACGVYISLDSDKRASERSLGLLQFCNLALRTADEHNVLSEQRDNLEALSATAGRIQALVGELPPDEQQKAQLVIDQVSKALDKQEKSLSDSLDRNAQAAAQERRQTEQVESSLSGIAADMQALKGVPAALAAERADLAALSKKLDARESAVDDKLDQSARAAAAERGDLAALAKRLDALESRLSPPAAGAAAPQVASKPHGP
jgi:hypothetical protein